MNRWLAIAGVVLAILFGLVFLRGPTPHIAISAETLTTLGPVGITNTMITSWLIVVLIVGTVFAATRKWELVPSGIQNLFEAALEGFYDIVTGIAGNENGRRFFPFVATIFFFILVSNWMSLTPVFNVIGWVGHDTPAEVQIEAHGFVEGIIFEDVELVAKVVFKGFTEDLGRDLFPVDPGPSAPDLDSIPRQADDSFDKAIPKPPLDLVGRGDLLPRQARDCEHHDVAPFGCAQRGEPGVGEGNLHTVQKLVDEEVIADQQGWQHRARGNPVGLDDTAPHRERHQNGDRESPELVPERAGGARRRGVEFGFLGGAFAAHPSSSRSAAKNASWGIST